MLLLKKETRERSKIKIDYYIFFHCCHRRNDVDITVNFWYSTVSSLLIIKIKIKNKSLCLWRHYVRAHPHTELRLHFTFESSWPTRQSSSPIILRKGFKSLPQSRFWIFNILISEGWSFNSIKQTGNSLQSNFITPIDKSKHWTINLFFSFCIDIARGNEQILVENLYFFCWLQNYLPALNLKQWSVFASMVVQLQFTTFNSLRQNIYRNPL